LEEAWSKEVERRRRGIMRGVEEKSRDRNTGYKCTEYKGAHVPWSNRPTLSLAETNKLSSTR
jgi:hypothetical protein